MCWTIVCVEVSSGYERTTDVLGERCVAEWHFHRLRETAHQHPDAWDPKFIMRKTQP